MVFNNLEEIQKYYNKVTNTYIFEEDGELIELVELNFNLEIYSDIKAGNINAWNINAGNINAWNINAGDINACNIKACNIKACNINAWNINASDIKAGNINAKDINACDIDFYACCLAYKNIVCKKITGRRENAKYFALDGEIIIKE